MFNTVGLLPRFAKNLPTVAICQVRFACPGASKFAEALKTPGSNARPDDGPVPSKVSKPTPPDFFKPPSPTHHQPKRVPPKPLESIEFCLNLVKKQDRENYLATLCIKSPVMRRIVLALRALNVELAMIKDSTSSAERARIRFHFWSKLVDEIMRRDGGQSPDLAKEVAYYNHAPVAKGLLDLFHLVKMDDKLKQYLTDLIGARVSSKAMGSKLFESMEELELYCSKSNSSLYRLCIELNERLQDQPRTGADSLKLLDATAGAMGVAQGLSNIIRGIPFNGSRDCCYVPIDLMSRHELTTFDFVGRSLHGELLSPVIESLAERCQELLDIVHSNQQELPTTYRELFLPRVAIQINLNRLRKSKYDICDRASLAQRSYIKLPLNLWLASKFPKAPII